MAKQRNAASAARSNNGSAGSPPASALPPAPPSTNRKRIAVIAAIVAVVAGLAVVMGGRILGGGPSSQTPVILISIDTLRSDHLPAYGYSGVSTPHLDAFRADAILYEHAYSHCPLTLPSHTSMLTGLLPADHGIRDNIGFTLAKDIPFLPELLKRNGYATGAAISAFVLRKQTGFDRGFDAFDDEVEPISTFQVIGRVQRPGGETVAVARKWLDANAGKPFFYFLHLYDPHTPYEPPEPFRTQYKDRPYDGEIAYTDQVIGEYLDDLKARGIYDKALIIVLADHGEGLNDHGEEEHGVFLYREAIQVPLIVKLPRGRHAGSSVSAPAALADVFPTILEQTATPVPAGRRESVSLVSLLDSGAARRNIYSETYYPRMHFGWSDLHSMTNGEHHLIRAPIPELYDLRNDPGEKKNVMNEQRRIYTALRAAIEPYVREAAAPSPIDPDEAAKLAALGYIGSTVVNADEEDLPDPKTTVDVFRQIRIAFTHYKDERFEECLALTSKLLDDNHRILDLWDLKSKTLAKLGRSREAIVAAQEGLKQQPQAFQLIAGIANQMILTGDLAGAEQHAALLEKSDPGQAHELRARIWADRKDYDKAETEARLAMKTGREPTTALMTLALISKQRGDLQTALQHIDAAAQSIAHKRNRRVPNLHFYRGDILARLGRVAEAEKEFRLEIATYPTEADAYVSLMLLLTSAGRIEEGTRVVYELIRAAPNPRSYVAISETLKVMGDDRGAVYWARQGLQRFPDNRDLRAMAGGGAVTGS
ncbi:MAG TPA: sulfatase-like hydrolase/transferase [Thermoanaerobaculia bacterium]|nr:sulfatase-like hydrolase/transferase [Thermoanaerobaculia bacterium]